MTTIGIGTQTKEQALASLSNMTSDLTPIQPAEYLYRIAKAQTYMQNNGIDAIYLNAGTNLAYFTGMRWYASERLVGAILPAKGEVQYIAPYFEIGSLNGFKVIDGPIRGWQEHQNPYQLFVNILTEMGIAANGTIGIDESAQFFIFDGINKAQTGLNLVNAQPVTAHCRMHKSANELALMQRAMDMTLVVHQATASLATVLTTRLVYKSNISSN